MSADSKGGCGRVYTQLDRLPGHFFMAHPTGLELGLTGPGTRPRSCGSFFNYTGGVKESPVEKGTSAAEAARFGDA